MGHSVWKHNHKLINSGLPIAQWHRPFFCRIFNRQIDDFQGRVVIREQFSLVGGFSDHTINRFNGIGGVNDFSDFVRVIEEPDQVSPVAAPGAAD